MQMNDYSAHSNSVVEGKKHGVKLLQLGDLVLLRVPHLSNASQKVISKFFHLYEGSFRIVRVVGENAFELVHSDNPDCVKGVYNRLKVM